MFDELVARRRSGGTAPQRGLVVAPGVAIVERSGRYRLLHVRSGCTLGRVDYADAEQAAHVFLTKMSHIDWTRHGAEIAADSEVHAVLTQLDPNWLPNGKPPVHGFSDVTPRSSDREPT